MDKINKFLWKLNKKERTVMLRIFEDILRLNLDNYDIKPLKGLNGAYRLRKGNIRIVFVKNEGQGIIVDIDYRKDIYKKF